MDSDEFTLRPKETKRTLRQKFNSLFNDDSFKLLIVYFGLNAGIEVQNGQLTKRDELLFLTVLALPYASSTGLACTMESSRVPFC